MEETRKEEYIMDSEEIRTDENYGENEAYTESEVQSDSTADENTESQIPFVSDELRNDEEVVRHAVDMDIPEGATMGSQEEQQNNEMPRQTNTRRRY